MAACLSGSLQTAQYLVARGVSVHACAEGGYNAWLAAASNRADEVDMVTWMAAQEGVDIAYQSLVCFCLSRVHC